MDGADQQEWHSAGAHTYRCESAGTIFFRISGDIAESHIAIFLDAVGRICDANATGHVFCLVDLGGLGSMSSTARKLMARTPLKPENKGMAVFGASFLQRVMVGLVEKATTLVQRNVPPLVFFDSEAEARAWIERRRSKLDLDQRVENGDHE